MEHSVRAYLERMHRDKLLFLVDHYLCEEEEPIADDVLQDILEVLLARNIAEGGCLSPYIDKLLELQKR